jgi:hypothetical protein
MRWTRNDSPIMTANAQKGSRPLNSGPPLQEEDPIFRSTNAKIIFFFHSIKGSYAR